MTESTSRYLPALRFRWLTRFYDPLVRAVLKEDHLRQLLVDQVAPRAGQRLLDLGCGTATLTILLKQACPGAVVVGLDADDEILAIARRKAAAAGVDLELRAGLAHDPPFATGSFATIVSSLVFHHLSRDHKRRTLARALDLLEPGGEIHIADWGQAQNRLMRLAFLGVQLFDGFATTTDNVRRGLVPFMIEAGFELAHETHREMTPFGTLSLYAARKPRGPG